ncbi:lysophospholipid acyltransferase family protein [Paucibacter sp. AS339]|uniref:lysophospholipid acyltransferase family protein n=1 Tax=Paucibacter hankyongi TaxID=3133434 RepID=UPI0030B7A4D0
MPASLQRGRRIAATALAFAAFGVGGLLLGLLYFPLLLLFQRNQTRRSRHARTVVSHVFAAFIALMRRLGLISYQFEHLERLQRPGLLILANHPSLIDVVFLISLIRNADCVVRAGLANNPFTFGPVRACAYVRNNEGPELLQSCMDSLGQGANLIIFPEGTRSRPGQALKMQRGAAQIAIRAERAVTPIRIHCSPPGLTKGQAWWRVADRALHFTISVGEDIQIQPFLDSAQQEPGLAARRLTAHLLAYFSHQGPTT